MKFALNDEQQALADTTHDFFESRVPSEVVRNAIVSSAGYDENLFTSMCTELGLSSLIIDEEIGGFGAGDVELAVVLEQHGYFLVPSPLRSHTEAIILISECASSEFKSERLSRMVTGENLAAAIFGDQDYTVLYEEKQGARMITGRFARVGFGHVIKDLYFAIEIEGELKLAHLDCGQDSVTQLATPSIDQTIPLGAIECEKSTINIIADDISETFPRSKSRAIIAACNEMVGSTQATLDMSVSFAKDRIQFGRPIGSFQAIKHKCADMLLETESARSIALYGAWLASQGAKFTSSDLEDDLDHIASMAKYYCSKSLSHAAGENIQIHGGVGFTMEHDAQLFFKRAAFMNAYLGLPGEHALVLSGQLLLR